MVPGRTFAVGDIHGCNQALVALLAMLDLAGEDTVVVLGDFVDRGPETRQVIDTLLALQQTCRLVTLLGNHEEMMRDALSGRGLYNPWLEMGGQAALDSYGNDPRNIPPSHIRFLVSCSPYWETDREIFVHAGLEPNVSLKNQRAEWLRWKRLQGTEAPHPSGKRIICGHTPQVDGRPGVYDGWVCLDTWAYRGQYLSALDVAADVVYQANQTGATRSFPLARASG